MNRRAAFMCDTAVDHQLGAGQCRVAARLDAGDAFVIREECFDIQTNPVEQRENFRQEKFQNRMKTAWQSRLLQENYRLQLMPRLLSALQHRVQRETHRLELLAQRVDSASPEKLLKKGYSLTLLDGKVVTDASLLKPGDEVETRLAKGKFRSKVINK